eukprot:2172002-Amphidinium_carterae.1
MPARVDLVLEERYCSPMATLGLLGGSALLLTKHARCRTFTAAQAKICARASVEAQLREHN